MPETALGLTSPASRTAVTVVDDGSVAALLRSLYAFSVKRQARRFTVNPQRLIDSRLRF